MDSVGNSLVEADKVDAARDILRKAATLGVTIQLPEDHVVAERLEARVATQSVPRDGIPSGWMGVDIGPQTVEAFRKAIHEAKTVVWNGPMGVFEVAAFAQGTAAPATPAPAPAVNAATTVAQPANPAQAKPRATAPKREELRRPRPRAPLRRRAPFAWLARNARSLLGSIA